PQHHPGPAAGDAAAVRLRGAPPLLRVDLPGPLAFAAIRQHAGPRRDRAGAHVGRPGLVLWHLSDPDFRRDPAPVVVWWHDRCAAAAPARGLPRGPRTLNGS